VYQREIVSKESIDDFNYLLQKKSWHESLSNSDVNTSFISFMDTILYHYNTTLLLKAVYGTSMRKNKRTTLGKRNSSERMRLLNGFKNIIS
jgi:hypothetical protein